MSPKAPAWLGGERATTSAPVTVMLAVAVFVTGLVAESVTEKVTVNVPDAVYVTLVEVHEVGALKLPPPVVDQAHV